MAKAKYHNMNNIKNKMESEDKEDFLLIMLSVL